MITNWGEQLTTPQSDTQQKEDSHAG